MLKFEAQKIELRSALKWGLDIVFLHEEWPPALTALEWRSNLPRSVKNFIQKSAVGHSGTKSTPLIFV